MAASVTKQWRPRVLVLGPGGIKGLKILGFLSTVEDAKFLESVDTYCGVSVGAILSLLIIAGYHIREIIGEATMLDLFKDLVHFNIKNSITNKGLMSSEPIKQHITELILAKFGVVPTLHGLYLQTGKALVTVTLNATDEECVMMGPFTHPSVSCVDATMFSMNIPFVFYQLIYQDKTYVDGALANPYPIDYFDDGNTDILGVYLCTNKALSSVQNLPNPPRPVLERIDPNQSSLSIASYWMRIIDSLIEQRRTHIMQHASARCKHVSLETLTHDLMGVTLTITDKVNMLVEGFNEGKIFLKQLRENAYVAPSIPARQRYSYPRVFENSEFSEK